MKFKNFNLIIYIVVILVIILFIISTIVNRKEDNTLVDKDLYLDSLLQVKDFELSSLENKVYFYQNMDKNIISINILLRGGSALDFEGYEGISEFFANILAVNAGDLNVVEFQKLLENYSIEIDTSVRRDNISITITGLSYYRRYIFEVLDLILNNNSFDPQAIELIKNQMLSNYNYNQTNAKHLINRRMQQELFPNSTYFRDQEGNPTTINKIDEDILREFQERAFNKRNMYISISGNLLESDLKRELINIINKMPDSESIIPDIVYVKPNITKKLVRVPVKNAKQSDIIMVFNAPFYNTMEFSYANIINAYFGRVPDSVLFNTVRNQEGLVYSIYSHLYGNSISSFWMIAMGTSFDEAENAILKSFNELNKIKNYNYKDIIVAKNWLFNNSIQAFSSNKSIARLFNNINFQGKTIDDIVKEREKINNISVEDINKVLEEVDTDNVLIFKVIPK